MARFVLALLVMMLGLPISAAVPHIKALSATDAVLLAVRLHPNVQHAQLDRVLDRFTLAIANNAFMPQYQLSGVSQWATGVKPAQSGIASVSVKAPWGTRVSVSKTLQKDGDDTNLVVSQPILRGLGAVNRIQLDNAQDQMTLGRLSLSDTLMSVINRALTSYWALIQAEQDLKVRQLSLDQTRAILKAYSIKVKIGQMARANLLQQKTALLQGQLDYRAQLNAIQTAQHNLKVALGLSPDASIHIVHDLNKLEHLKLPTLDESIRQALAHNVGYLKHQLLMHSLARGILSAEDAQRWQLDAEGQWSAKHHWQTDLKLSIPIHDLTRQQQLVSARVAYRQAQLQLEQARRQLISDVKINWDHCRSQLEQIRLAQQTVKLTHKDYQLAQRARLAGINSTYEVIAQQEKWVEAQLQLSALKIGYLNTLISFHQQLGTTLSLWKIHLNHFEARLT